jgi:pilus assembly protein FimV
VGYRSLIASLVTLALGLAPAALQAAGLGRLVILSSIGQPLAGEIELVSVGKAELTSLAARIAPASVFESANIRYNSALVGATTTIERRANGQPYIRLNSARPVDEPFLDLLVELTWSTGRLVREYTALIDPPGAAATPAQAAAPAVAAPVSAAASPAASPRPQAAVAPDAGQKSYGPVQPGDTLRKIAAGVRPQGVNLDQMLVGIFRSNPDAFINNNMNLLRSGKILRIPEAGELGQVGTAEANKEVQAQSADWNAYRQRVAGSAPDAASGEARAAAGKIATRVEDAATTAKEPAKEVVKISKGLPGKEVAGADKGLQDRVRVLEEEVTAREKSLKDAGERIASLEKTIKDMQRLLEIKGATPPVAAGATPDTAKPSVEVAKPEIKDGDKPVADAPTQPKAPVADVKPAPKPVTPAPAPPAVAEWWEDPTVLGGGLLGLGALGGAAYLLARRRREPEEAAAAEPVARRVPSMAAAPAAAAAASVATAATTTSQMPAQAAASTAAAAQREDVDPIAEADVYIAYGRDAQAEEILKEALTKTPNRQEIKGKLLEIYAARKSKGEFNALASELNSATGGKGELWLKVAGLGFALDPDNALYAAGKDSAGLTPLGVQTDVNLDFDLDMVSAAGAPSTVTDLPVDPRASTGNEVKTTILSPDTMAKLRAEGEEQAGSSQQANVPDTPAETATFAGTATDISIDVPPLQSEISNVIDFEFDPTKTANLQAPMTATFEADKTALTPPESQDKALDSDLQINLDSLDAKIPADAANDAPEAPATAEISFDFNVPAIDAPPTVAGAVPPTDIKLDVPEFKPADTAAMDFALDTVSFDLGSGQTRETPAAAPAHDEHWYDVQTKFDLAKAYQEMGDKDGAREILSEVMKEGDAQQQAEAKELLAKLD